MAEYIEQEKAYELASDFAGQASTKAEYSAYWKVARAINELPTADVVEVKHGEWLDVQYTYFGAKRYECSQCRDDEFWKKRYIEIKENYCPNCGAKMDGEKNEAN